MVTPLLYEEWKKLPGAELPPDNPIEKHPHRFEFGVENGKPVARMTDTGINELLASLEKENGLPTGTLIRVLVPKL